MHRASAALIVFACAACATGPVVVVKPFRAGAPATLRDAYLALPARSHETEAAIVADNLDAWVQRWAMLRSATRSIDLVTFILDNDVYGFAVLGKLIEKARAGVAVRFVVDARGTSLATPLLGRDYLDELAGAPGTEVRVYNPPTDMVLESLLRGSFVPMLASNHDKILVVDGRVGMIGGRNITRAYFADPYAYPHAWEDLDVVLRGPGVVGALEQAFGLEYSVPPHARLSGDVVNMVPRDEELLLIARAMDLWMDAAPLPLVEERALLASPARQAELASALEEAAATSFDPPASERARRRARPEIRALVAEANLRGAGRRTEVETTTSEVRILDKQSRVGARRDAIASGLATLIRGARREIVVESPYFVLTPEQLADFADAARRGVAITIFTNSASASDNEAAQAVFLRDWPEVLARVPTMRLHVTAGERRLHTKRFVFDDDVLLVGTYNLDPFSYSMNSEIMAAFWSRDLAVAARAQVAARVDASDVLEYRIRRTGDGAAIRWPKGHRRAGRPVVDFGPEQHEPPEALAGLDVMWAFLWATQGLFETEALPW